MLRLGGRVALAVWGAADRNPFFSALGMSLVRAGHMPPPDPGDPGPFSLDDPERVRGLLEGAGFAEARAEEVAVHFDFRDVDECLAFAADTPGPMGVVLQGLSEAGRAQIAGSLEAAFAPFRTGTGYERPGVTVVAVAA